MKKFFVFLLIVIIGFGLFWLFKYIQKNKSNLSKDQKEIVEKVGNGVITINDLHLDKTMDVDFENNKAIIKNDQGDINYAITDILRPFNIDGIGEEEYPFLLKANYPDKTNLYYLVISRYDKNKFVSVDQVIVGNVDQINAIHEYNDKEVIIDAFIETGNGKERIHLAYTFSNDKIIPDKNNIDLLNYKQKENINIDNNNEEQKNVDNQTDGMAGKVALSFDDGPGYYTPQILDVLKDNNIKATFFVIGQNIDSNIDFLKRAYKEGHEIGNHTFTHPDLSSLSYDAQMDEIKKTNDKIKSIIPEANIKFLRPPYGNYNEDTKNILNQLGLKLMLWNVDTRDWSGKSSNEIVSGALENLQDGAIILMHDGVANSGETAKALPEIIRQIKNQNFSLVKISQIN